MRTYDSGTANSDKQALHYLVMEYVEGQTLGALVRELGRVPEELCRHVGCEVAKGLAAIHAAGVVHRDIKPENVLITEDHVVKVMDLGVAFLQDEAVRLSQTGMFIGSVEYASPEQFTGEPAEPPADLYSLGVLLYELATGRHPFRDSDMARMFKRILDGEPRRAGDVNPQLSPFFEELVHTLMAKKADARLASAGEVVDLLEEGEEGAWWQARAKALRVETKQPLRRIRVPRETALHGRDADLASLEALFEKAKAGEGQVVLVEGEAGIGKTRLVDEFVGRLRQSGDDLNFLFGSHPPGGAATALGAFSTAYKEQLGEAGLEDTLGSYLAPTPILIPAFAALLRGEGTPPGAESLTADSIRTVFVHATRALASERPTIVMIDDLHFAPDDGRALFASLAAAIPDERVLLVGTGRPGLSDDWIANLERLGHASRLTLGRLGAKDLVHLLKDAFRSDALAEQLGAQVAVKSDGNPFFAFEIIKGLRDGAYITQSEDGRWISTQEIRDIQIPSSVVDLIQARLANLTEDEQDLLEVASCAGFEFDPLVVAEAAGLARIPALKLLGRIEKKHRLVRSAGRHLTFDHHQAQESLYAGILEALRAEYHAQIAAVLEARAGGGDTDPEAIDGALAVEVSEHYLRGDRHAEALRFLDPALTHLIASHAHEHALALADLALAADGSLGGTQRVDVLRQKDICLHYLGRRAEQEATLEEARALAEGDPGRAAKVEIAMSRMLEELGRWDEALSCADRALELAAVAEDDESGAAATERLGRITHVQGDYERSHAYLEDALAWYRELGNRRREGAVGNSLALLARERGDAETARTLWDRCLEIAADGHRSVEIAAMGNISGLAIQDDRLADALVAVHRTVELAREVGDRSREGFSAGMRGLILGNLGDPGAARASLQYALALTDQMGDPRMQGYWLECLASAAEESGDDDEADRLTNASIELRRSIGHQYGLGASLGILGARLVRRGRHDEARTVLEEALAIARELGLPQQVNAACALAKLPGGDVAEAIASYEEHKDRLAPFELRPVHLWLYELTGDVTHLQAAHDELQFAIEHAPQRYRESIVENVRINREIMASWEESG